MTPLVGRISVLTSHASRLKQVLKALVCQTASPSATASANAFIYCYGERQELVYPWIELPKNDSIGEDWGRVEF